MNIKFPVIIHKLPYQRPTKNQVLYAIKNLGNASLKLWLYYAMEDEEWNRFTAVTAANNISMANGSIKPAIIELAEKGFLICCGEAFFELRYLEEENNEGC